MNSKLLLIAFVFVGLCSCTTAYKIGQTPDDVYYSPVPQQGVYVNTTNEEEKPVYSSSSEDREIRMKINHRGLRRYDYDYGYNYPLSYPNPYAYNYPYAYGYDYNGFNYNYNYPYYYSPIYINPKIVQVQPTYIGPRKYNLGTYTKPSISANIIDLGTGRIMPSNNGVAPVRTFTKPTSNGTGVGNLIRKVFSSPDVNRRTYNNDDNSQRTFESSRNTPGNNSSSSSPSTSNSSSAPVRTFHK